MRIVQAPRASAVLYQLLLSQKEKRLWLLPANICPIVPVTFMKAGVPFELIDISAATLHMDLKQAEAWIRKRKAGGLLYAHTYGESSTPNDFFETAKSLNPEMLIVDDRCLCIPGFARSAGADLTLFSTGYAKIFEMNFGGYAVINEDVAHHPVHLKYDPAHYVEIERSYQTAIHDRVRYDYRGGDWLETDAALPEWDQYRSRIENGLTLSLAQRKTLNAIYASRLPSEIQLPEAYQLWRFNIRVKNKPRVLKAIFDNGLFASSHYASLAGIMSEGHAPVADGLADEVINLFNDHHFDVQRAERICEIILNCESS